KASAELFDPDALSALGIGCSSAAECLSGYCVDGVCCDSACDAGDCDGCSSGVCQLHTNVPCDDLDACTQNDACQSGVCVGTNPIACVALDECHEPGVCDAALGTCSNPVKMDGEACSAGNCVNGVCQPVSSGTATGGGMAGAGGENLGGSGGI